jgi:hypothetical protein
MGKAMCVKITRIGLNVLVLISVFSGTISLASTIEEELPIIDGKPAVATVGGEPISLEEFKRALISSHRESFSKPGPAMEELPDSGDIDYSRIIDRLVDIRLILIEAGNMGLEELPEIRNAVVKESEAVAIEMFLQRLVEDVRAEDAEVEVKYRDRVREWKIRSARFKNGDAARKIAARIQEGGDFDVVMQAAVADGLAELERAGQYLKNAELMPAVAQLVSTMEIGEVSPVVPVGREGYIIFQLQGMRYPEKLDREVWQEAGREVLNRKRTFTARQYYEGLRNQQAEVDTGLLDSLDYESEKPGVDALRNDRRVLAEIKGQEPIRVADLTLALEEEFFHGFQQAVSSRRVNAKKAGKLEQMLEKRILLREARQQGLDSTAEYRLRLAEYEDAMLFGVFVDKVIIPDIQLDAVELKRYYEDHAEDFTAPRMIRMKSLVFQQRGAAVDALEKLSRGTDFEWMAANTAGLVPANALGRMRFDGRLVTQRGLPEKLQKAVAGSRRGDYRLYSDPEHGYHYVLRIEQVVDPGPKPFIEVRKDIAEKLYEQKLEEGLRQWSRQLREHYPVKVYLTQPD